MCNKKNLSLDLAEMDAAGHIEYYTSQIVAICNLYELNRSVVIQDFVNAILEEKPKV